MGGLSGLLVLLVVAFVLVGAAVALFGSRDRALRVVRIGGVVAAAGFGVVALVTAVQYAVGAPMRVSIPLAPRAVSVPSGVTFQSGPVATITGGGIDRADLTLTGLSVATRGELIAAALVIGAVSVIVSLALSRIAGAALRGRPFVPAVAGSVTLTAGAVLVGGVASAVLQQWGEWSAGRDALFVAGYGSATATTLAEAGWPEPAAFSLEIPFLPVLLGVGLLAVAAVFRAGTRMQRDTDGLV